MTDPRLPCLSCSRPSRHPLCPTCERRQDLEAPRPPMWADMIAIALLLFLLPFAALIAF